MENSLCTPALNNKDILISNRATDIDACLTIGELLEITLPRRCPKTLTNGLSETGMARARENFDPAHDERGRK